MFEAMTWLETSLMAETLRGLGIWSYGIINLIHIIGICCLFGAVVILDLRLMKLWLRVPLPLIASVTVPVATFGGIIAIPSGIAMFLMNAAQYYSNVFLYLKLPVLGLALLNVVLVTQLAAWRRAVAGEISNSNDGWVLALAGGTSLVLWTTVITCGRMIGYW